MRLVFCGTPQFAVPVLEAVIAAGHEVALVLTQPDRPVGRDQKLQAPPVKQVALAHSIPVLQPEKIKNNPELRAKLEEIAPDAILVVAYGRLIPEWMLNLPRHGNINLHGSLLPKYRGAAPIQWAVANGETVTGVTTMRLDAGLDTGPMLLAQAIPIGEEETSEDVYENLAEVGAPLMVETLRRLEAGELFPTSQDERLATHAPILSREDGRIDFDRTAKQIRDRWRGFQPWPGAFTVFREKKLIVHRLHCADHPDKIAPGVIHLHEGKVLVGCGSGTIVLDEVQVEGKKRMPAEEFARGYQINSGERLGV
ncbi:methionyl-tRNA formyltransferase [Edaphobacter sp. 12200R-103]|jgi:methionyl-tRNA formyltransferase|uniref:methionyl-tRNA formyltransferase n=1 Tax=Edaphobacter sp. 12200R-103 TaxID=2703788 RepID=UPI00138DA968|nr:methionyl-tRNA formyltransferase [Edaphobacter sp. 12200R-103]QHS50468.1 methionyl-tRNA formyltransferase [Edaphobacter sp. 12200R-103]